MERAEVERLFSQRLGAAVEVLSLHQTFPGQSRETWLVQTAVGPSVEQRGFVLRVDPPGGGIVPLPLEREWKVYELLAKTEIPVGEPLWFDEDPSWFDGRPYFVRDLVEGSTQVPGLYARTDEGESLRRQVALEHATHLARLHTLDWEAAGFGSLLDVPSSPGAAPRLEFDTWRSIWEDVKPEPFPMITLALQWLEDRLPATAPRVSLLKGNNGLGEEIWRDARIVALSDWELASLGDPAQDWAFSQGLLALWDRERTLEHYEAVAGFELDRGSLDFWSLWTLFKALCCTTAGLRAFLAGRDQRAVLPTIGFGTVHVMEQVLGTLTTMELADAARVLASMSGRQLEEPAAGGGGR
jgi:aminoglycoside phosphotransferase (APT) family kinase protein